MSEHPYLDGDGRFDVLPSVTANEMKEVDRIMVEELGIGLLQMMEHAGRNLTEVARTVLGGELKGRKMVVLVPFQLNWPN